MSDRPVPQGDLGDLGDLGDFPTPFRGDLDARVDAARLFAEIVFDYFAGISHPASTPKAASDDDRLPHQPGGKWRKKVPQVPQVPLLPLKWHDQGGRQ
jgi:hypothetical protein